MEELSGRLLNVVETAELRLEDWRRGRLIRPRRDLNKKQKADSSPPFAKDRQPGSE